MDKKTIDELIKAFELCKQVIQLLHPVLDPDEPCIAWEAFETADHQIEHLRHLTSRSSRAAETCADWACGSRVKTAASLTKR